ncbi:class I SAM-dependent methyltransferase [Alishewanella jeotgali]|uniref:Class I SAM-dependent methyltransferase n=1 Tax=Alishewanella jeotgali KCTC 22429 TaxID=1129374 RepID=H3ZBJ3_9ALTE|nr:class I SAM-dependent methyltransferase [Alishewanella jeotgali]EHR42307.1 hypothetical protein AJE_03491 [Alishewanella jeotgali KCTC 22429]
MTKVKRESVIFNAIKGGVGIELGVAEGVLSERIMQLNHLSFLYGVDMYAGDRGHDVYQYKTALRKLERFKEKYSLIKMRFDEALDLFPDSYFDFIYVDGYAHTGEEEGKTLHDWFPKLKPNGIFAGDDYHPDWPMVMEVVDSFVKTNSLSLNIIDCHEPIPYCEYPTWFVIK